MDLKNAKSRVVSIILVLTMIMTQSAFVFAEDVDSGDTTQETQAPTTKKVETTVATTAATTATTAATTVSTTAATTATSATTQ